MTDEQIIALSRQFAEEMCSEMEDSFEKDEAINVYELHFQLAMGFLKERFCLVEKSVIKETWKEITDVYLEHSHITYDGARVLFYDVLFPEIGKEVENG
ncbi:MAG: hypothetical protein J6K19_03815 [Prevotella sp.]|nr:hypothetical protein [Prevotella sp.]